MVEQSITAEILLEKAKNQALKYITARMRSGLEMKQYLQKKGYDAEIILQVLEFLEHYNYLDDNHFCRLWIEDKVRFHPCGRQKMKMELKQKGISAQLIEANLAMFYSKEAEYQVALALADKHHIKADNFAAKRGKMGRYLYSKGFSGEIIEQVLAEIVE